MRSTFGPLEMCGFILSSSSSRLSSLRYCHSVAHLSTPVCHAEGLVCRRKLFQPTEGARYCHQVLPESNPGELMPPAWCCNPLVVLDGSLAVSNAVLPSHSQVDPGFAYAYTLLGHEFVLTEELDRALACFRNAIRVNSRHYNAWYVTMVTYSILDQIKVRAIMSLCTSLTNFMKQMETQFLSDDEWFQNHPDLVALTKCATLAVSPAGNENVMFQPPHKHLWMKWADIFELLLPWCRL